MDPSPYNNRDFVPVKSQQFLMKNNFTNPYFQMQHPLKLNDHRPLSFWVSNKEDQWIEEEKVIQSFQETNLKKTMTQPSFIPFMVKIILFIF